MIVPASRVNVAKKASCSLVRLLRCTLGSLIVAVGCQQRVACGVGAGQHSDGAAPLHLEFGEVTFKSGAGKQRRIDTAQCQVGDDGGVSVVAAEPFVECVLGERVGGE